MTGEPLGGGGDLTAKARIRDAALALYAEHGFGVTARAIADRAGVSHALITFHFGTKEALRTTVEDLVFERFWAALHPVVENTTLAEPARRRAMVEVLRMNPSMIGFFRRVLFDDSPRSHDFIERLLKLEQDQLADQQSEGTTRVLKDPQIVAMIVTALHVGLLTMVPVVERTLGASVLSDQVLDRWFDAQYEVLTRGLFIRD
jgi:AcrR family transcriptional regulator